MRPIVLRLFSNGVPQRYWESEEPLGIGVMKSRGVWGCRVAPPPRATRNPKGAAPPPKKRQPAVALFGRDFRGVRGQLRLKCWLAGGGNHPLVEKSWPANEKRTGHNKYGGYRLAGHASDYVHSPFYDFHIDDLDEMCIAAALDWPSDISRLAVKWHNHHYQS